MPGVGHRIVLLAVMLLGGCSLFGDDDVVQQAPVPEINNQFDTRILWERRIGSGVEGYFSRLQPALANNKLYVADRFGEVKALDPETGNLIWEQDLSKLESNNKFDNNSPTARLSGGITVTYDALYIGTENADLIALNANTGELLWQAKTAGEVISSPLVDGGRVVVPSASGEVEAFDASNGKPLWKQSFSVPPLSLRSQSQLVSSSGAVLYGRADGRLELLLLDSGQLVREHKIATPKGSTEIARLSDVDSTPIILAGVIYVIGFNGDLHAIELQSGNSLWKRSYSSYQDMAISGYDIFVSDAKGHLFSIQRQEGLERWSNVELEWRNLTPPAVAGQYVLVGDAEGYLYWLDRDSGQIVSLRQLDSAGLYVAPLVTKHRIYVQSRSGKIMALSRPKK